MGNYYESDRNTFRQAMLSFTRGQPSEDWLNYTLRYRDGRISMKSLRNHFVGKGNATRNIYEEERLRDYLYLASELFFTKRKKM